MNKIERTSPPDELTNPDALKQAAWDDYFMGFNRLQETAKEVFKVEDGSLLPWNIVRAVREAHFALVASANLTDERQKSLEIVKKHTDFFMQSTEALTDIDTKDPAGSAHAAENIERLGIIALYEFDEVAPLPDQE